GTQRFELPSAEAVLRDGRRVLLRPIRPDDRKRWFDFVHRLTPRTRYLRFQYAKSYFSEEEADYYTHVTPPERGAYVAALSEGQEERIIAVGRWDVTPGQDSAEVALVVEDDVQFRGIGTSLLEQLAVAASDFDIRSFEAQVLSENTGMQGVFESSGLRFTKRLEEGIYQYHIDLTQREEFARRREYREHVARSAGVRHLLQPKSIAVIGASRDPESPGGAIFRNLLRGGFTGTVFPVNPKTGSVAGVMSYPSIADVPGDVDLAVIVVPAAAVLGVVDDCARKGVWALVVISAGFGEIGGEGTQREHALRERVLAYGGRLIGPNCLGIVNANPSVSMNATFAPSFPPSGKVSMGSQSGALGIALLDYMSSMNLGLAQFVSFGNRADVSSNDLLEYWEDDVDTRVILLYLESFGNSRKFTRIARRVSRLKPIVAVKGGRSVSGARAASSHTGSLAGADIAADVLFRQAGVIRVGTIEEMFGVAQLLAHQPAPKGNRVAIVTNAGGPGILAADACDSWGLEVPQLSESTQATLRGFLPPEASVTNPVDMIASASPDHYRQAISTVLGAPEVDTVVLIYIPPLVTTPEEVAAAVRQGVTESGADKPVLACFMMARGAPPELKLGEGRYIPSYIFPDDAIRALAHASEYAEYRDAPEGKVVLFDDVDADGARELLRTGIADPSTGGWLAPDAALRLMQLYGVPAAPAVPARSAAEAAERAAGLG
ncbi:MAG: GNAT family N-acetyltransferase, partial [Chloroflexi bacterium]|nr:GNAT family N-acetyltransferase [Chloroflexota bacterium]